MRQICVCIGIFVALSMSRFVPHPPNFTSLLALSFYVPALLGIRYLPVLLVSFAITDFIIGYHLGTHWTWGSVLIIGLISRYFSKNTAINILIALCVTSVYSINNKIQEGFEGKEGAGDSVQSKVKKTETKLDKKEKDDKQKCGSGEKMENGKCVKKSGFQNNVPSSKPAAVNNNEPQEIDVAAQMEDAYGNLNKMLGDGTMKSMADETKKLVAQQKELMNTLSSMTPSLNKAKETLENLNMPNMEEMAGILKKFT